MSTPKPVFLILLFFCACKIFAQADSTLQGLQQVPAKYFRDTEKKISKYTSRISSKTEKTLSRLCKWEAKVQTLLQKVNPAAAEKLFANEQFTFRGMLMQYKKGEALVQNYASNYDEYRDKLTTQIGYLDSNRNLLSKKAQGLVSMTKAKTKELNREEERVVILQKMIRERKKQLLDEAVKYLGKNKHLQKINKETYYYVETLRNYKLLFNSKTKREEVANMIVEKIPGFDEFMRKNSLLASIFKLPANYGTPQSLAGLQTRAGLNNLIQTRMSSGGPNAMTEIKQNLQAAQNELTNLKNKIIKAGGNSSSDEFPDFKPNNQKTKTFLQRIEIGPTFQFGKRNGYVPGTADIGINIGYKINDKSTAGIGVAYKLGMGSIQKIRFTHEGIGLRSFLDWKLKKQFYVTGGYEINHHSSFKNFQELKMLNAWQQSGLIGLSKKISLKTKFTKGTKLQLLYDLLNQGQASKGSPFIFRVGYDIK